MEGMLILRKATPDDALAMYHIEETSFSIPWSLQSIEEELHSDNRLYLLAEIDGQVIGYAGAWLVLDEGQITNIAISPDYRRQGYGAKMTRKLVKLLTEAGMKEIFLEVRVSNIAAQAMYRRLGFTVKGLRKGYYEKPKEDAMIMSVQVNTEENSTNDVHAY